ncbi:MAG TPA: efflux RND transporter periplasmic adaptor subunit [Calditrichia bacterium]|nr:efflux RND transporter periplasmic adaptor subunit [Calditrichia bacterium]HQV31819.1 efflux RND transporter periplasmic adaptor subunit [Calditrichia bacterium]
MKYGILKYLSLALLLLVSACGSDEEASRSYTGKTVAVSAITAKSNDQGGGNTYSGSIVAVQSAVLSTRMSGWVEAIPVKEGDRVSKGQVLLRLRNNDLEARLAQTEAGIREAEAHFKNMETNLKRLEALYAQKAATQKEMDDMRTAFVSAESRLTQARQMKREVQENLRYSILKAPFDGQITAKRTNVGDLVNPGQPALAIENAGQVEAVIQIPESDISKLAKGDAVTVTVTSLPGDNRFSGVISQLVTAADPMSRQFSARILLNNKDGRIKSGMFARVAASSSGNSTIMVPDQALVRRGQLTGLFVINEDQTARLRWVRIGRDNGDMLEVLSGLQDGDRVVSPVPGALYDGMRVEVQ